MNLQPADYETAALPIELRGHGMDAGTFTPPLLPRYFGLCFFAFTPYFTCERITGIEPAFPAWEAGILAVVLYPHGDRFHLSREEESNPISRESNPALPVRTAAVLSIDCEVKTVSRMPMRHEPPHCVFRCVGRCTYKFTSLTVVPCLLEFWSMQPDRSAFGLWGLLDGI